MQRLFVVRKALKDYKGTVIAITHDRYFLDNVSEWILELDQAMVFLGKVIIHHGLSKNKRALWMREKRT